MKSFVNANQYIGNMNFNELKVNRVIMHSIIAKMKNQDHATVEESSNLIEASDAVLKIIKVRLIDAAGKNSKAFELEVENSSHDSFYTKAKSLKQSTEAEFINTSQEIAYLLAETQTRVGIPGGYLIVIDGTDEITGVSYAIVIKAEPHEALKQSIVNGVNKMELLEKVFLSPSQKLFKIGILVEKLELSDDSNSTNYSAFLFDDQFRTDSHPAEYFYKDFLGFSTSKNAKIQTQRFYSKTNEFIKTHVSDFRKKVELFGALKTHLTTNNDAVVNPQEFSTSFFPTNDLKDKYNSEVVSQFDHSFEKDNILIKNQLEKRNMNFPQNIKIIGPDAEFDERVNVVNSVEELEELEFDPTNHTIIKISGKPYPNE